MWLCEYCLPGFCVIQFCLVVSGLFVLFGYFPGWVGFVVGFLGRPGVGAGVLVFDIFRVLVMWLDS